MLLIKRVEREIHRAKNEAEIIDKSILSFKSEMSEVLFFLSTSIDTFSEFSMRFNQEASKSQIENLKFVLTYKFLLKCSLK